MRDVGDQAILFKKMRIQPLNYASTVVRCSTMLMLKPHLLTIKKWSVINLPLNTRNRRNELVEAVINYDVVFFEQNFDKDETALQCA